MNALDQPDFVIFQSRVKRHFQRSGELVGGEEHLRKIILGWYGIPQAQDYQICHQCMQPIDNNDTDESKGDLTRTIDETVTMGTIMDTAMCADQPCVVIPAAPMGWNHFHMRYMVDGEWSPWSTAKNFNVGEELGSIDHEEL